MANFAAVKLVKPELDPDPYLLTLMFLGMGLVGTLVGASVRKYMVRYYFPSGTACAVIARSVSQADDSPDSQRPVWMLKVWGSIAAAVALPMKIAWTRTGAALLPGQLSFGALKGTSLGLALDPLLFGIGIVVGPRIGLGMIIGSAAPIAMAHFLAESSVPADDYGLWVRWLAIAVLTLPTFASILFAYLFRTPAVVPAGLAPASSPIASPAAARSFTPASGL